jgi:PAS domain S-box-containing protein
MTTIRRHLLLVEDNPADARLVRELVAEERDTAGFDVEAVGDLASATALLAEKRFDAVLLDLSLPDSHGTETVATLRRSGAPPIVVLTGLEDDDAAYDALRKGAQDYLVKGRFDSALLARAIRYAIQRHAAEEAVQRTLSLLRATLESSADGIVVIDHAGKIVNHNERFVGMFAVPHAIIGSADGDGWQEFLLRHLVDPDRFHGRLHAVLGDEEQSYDLLELRDGRILEALSMPYVVGVRHASGRVWTFRDVTERRRAIEELRRARQEAEAANRAKSEFLANLSHEIRTPLNTIVGAIELISESPQTAEQARGVDLLHGASQALLGLVGDVLDLSKIEAGRLELQPARFVLADVVQGSLQLLQSTAARKGLTLQSQMAEDLPREVLGDPNRLRQILINVLSNAIKFAEHGGVELHVRNDRAADSVLFTVTDSGVGIPATKLASVFENFEQVETRSGAHDGTGLGLGIARRLVELMGGRIWAESEPGRGSRFHFTARLRRPARDPAREPLEKRPTSSLEDEADAAPTLRVLLADDCADNRELVRFYLKKLRCDVDDAADGAVALEKFRSGNYDIVLMDLHMPVLDGLDAMSAMRRFEQTEHLARTPILALTADAFDANLARCLQSGYSGVLTKPLTRAQLIAAIAEHVDRRAS